MNSHINSFSIITCVDGSGLINYKNETVVVNKGDSILIPANLGNYELKGALEVLVSKPTIIEE